MLKDRRILYAGTAWPTAEVVDRRPVVTKFIPPAGSQVRQGFDYTLTATGKGKAWSTTRPLAFWRDFTAVAHDAGAETPMLAFVQQWGDPGGKINGKGGAAESWDWVMLTASLLHIAQAWDAPDAAGVSYFGSNDLARMREARAHWRNFLFPNFIQTDVELEVDPAGSTDLVLRAKTLAAFMGLSASSAMARAVPMRRCQYCTGWFELGRRDARFCSASCRAHAHTLKQQPIP